MIAMGRDCESFVDHGLTVRLFGCLKVGIEELEIGVFTLDVLNVMIGVKVCMARR